MTESNKEVDIGWFLFSGMITVLSLGTATVAISMTRYVTAALVGLPAAVWLAWVGVLAGRGLVAVGVAIYREEVRPRITEVSSS